MNLELLERTEAKPSPPRAAHHPTYVPVHLPCAFWLQGSFDIGVTITSTGGEQFALLCDAGTLSDPSCRVDVPKRTPARDLLEIRFLTGLTWAELAELFGVSRRAVHHWANEEPMKHDNVLLVRETLRHVQRLRRLNSAETRLALLTPTPSGRPLDLLKACRWGAAIAAMQSIPTIDIPPSPHPDPAQRHPATYFGALVDRPIPPSGRPVSGRSRRITRRPLR
jgi:transcriptional regulator with XRE-family HTH domain